MSYSSEPSSGSYLTSPADCFPSELAPAKTALLIYEKVRTAIRDKSPLVQLPPGRHHVTGDFLPSRHLWMSNNDSGHRNILIDATGAENLVIDGNGCTILIEGMMIPVLLGNCRNVILKNISIDWVRPGFTEVEITASAPGAIEFDTAGQLDVDRGRLIAKGGGNWPFYHLFNILAFDRVRREPLAGSGENWNLERAHRATKLEGNRIRLEADFDSPPPAGGPGILMHGDRVAPAIVIDASQGVTLEDVAVHHALGMGVIAQISSDLTFRRLRVVPSGDRMFSTWVDATHAVDCSGFLRMEHCEFRGMFDDGTNIHGVFHRSAGWLSPRRVLMETLHFQQFGVSFLKPGDFCRLCDPVTLLPIDTLKVAAVHRVNPRFHEVEFENVPKSSGMVCVIHRFDPDFVVEISNSVISQHRGRGMLLSIPGPVRVHNNHFHNSGTAVLVAPDASYWWESGPALDLVVENNVFDACGYAMCGPNVLAVDAPKDGAPLHGKVSLISNDIRLARPVVVDAKRVAELVVTGNQISRHPDYPFSGEWTPLLSPGCGNVTHDLPEVLR